MNEENLMEKAKKDVDRIHADIDELCKFGEKIEEEKEELPILVPVEKKEEQEEDKDGE